MAAPRFEILSADLLEAPADLPACVLAPDANAVEQARACGQVLPLLVARKDEKFEVLGGITEWRALAELGISEMTCRIVQGDDADTERIFPLRIALDAEAYRESPVLRAWLLAEARKAGFEERHLLALLPLTGQTAKPGVLQDLQGIARLPGEFQEALHTGLLNLKSLPQLRHLPECEQPAVLALLRRYRFGGSKQHKILEYFAELCLREECAVEALVSAWRKTNPPTDNLPQEGQHLLRWLEERVHPALNAAEAAFQEKARSLNLPKGLTLTHTQCFEDDTLTVQISCRNWPELERRLPGIRAVLSI